MANVKQLPSELRINGVNYEVVLCNGLNDGSSILYGEFDEQKQTISINTKNQDLQGQWRTLLHEVCHAMLYEYDIANKGYDSRVPRDEETICELFSRGFYQLIADNRDKL